VESRLAALGACALTYVGCLFLIVSAQLSRALLAVVIAISMVSGALLLRLVWKRVALPWLRFPKAGDAKVVDSVLVKYPTAFSPRHLAHPLFYWVLPTSILFPLPFILLVPILPPTGRSRRFSPH